ncbi:MAG: tRNA dihydrouridine synthase DusB [Clostridia bacterium]|nr:tRNA dihydrouridine synthase DusB [Clostridia bacterium]
MQTMFRGLLMETLLYLAPLAGITDSPFRRLCKKYGADVLCTEMISSRGIYYKDRKTAELLSFKDEEQPIGIQLFGNDPDIMAYAAKVVEERNPAFIDINMGCPMPKIVNNGDGCALMNDPLLAGKVIEAAVKAVKCPVTVKFRAGYSADRINAVEFAEIAEKSGASRITVHPRTRDQLYSGKADREIIAKVKNAVKIPVIGNGDIFSPESAKEMIEKTGCDGIMIARGALGNPFIFTYIKDYFATGSYSAVSAEKSLCEALWQTREMCAEKPEKVAVAEARKHLAWYVKGLRGSAKVRNEIMKAQTYTQTEQIITEYLKESGCIND